MNGETPLPAPEAPLLLPAPTPHGPEPKTSLPPRTRLSRRGRVVAIAVAVLAVLLLVGWFSHHRQASAAKEALERKRGRLPTVSVIDAKPSASTTDLLLPGSITAMTEASLYARASGYLRTRSADIGDIVKRGQLLAEVDSPDLDQQVLQGRAAVAQSRQQLGQARAAVGDAKARVDLARTTYDRLVVLVRDLAVSQQDVDQGRQNLETAVANLASSNANVGVAQEGIAAAEANARRLVVLQDYEKVRAPFDGIVTARNVDVGALIGSGGGSAMQSTTVGVPTGSSGGGASGASGGSSALAASGGGDAQGSSGGSSGELFRIAQIDRLRVFVTVPQENAGAVEPGNDASVFVQGRAEPTRGKVVRTARAIDPVARTLLTEVEIDNADRALMPGMYAQVRFRSPRSTPPILVPGEAVIARADGLRVAVVEPLRPEDRARLPKQPAGGETKGDAKKDDAKKDDAKKDDAKKDDAKDDKKGDAKNDDAKQGDADDKPQNLDDARRIHLRKVEVGRDYGTAVEITQGLEPGMKVVANPGDETADDALVMPTQGKPLDDDASGQGGDRPPGGNASPSMTAPTKGKPGGKS